ncbi:MULTISPECIES: FAD-dependent oxidoreductase [unclassified Hyphomicrobium]|uniref:FAD-dependent oxidoreductase n=1 Tax=unclassified Hyphomicrobium TaxID=2619925 RepID=UPI00045E6D11|nr:MULTISPECIES: FAD-dependent oxidoreductase [unclassified Hyphomicrobium]
MTNLPSHARIVIVGGGIIGCSTAYHLAKMGCTDVVLIEKAQLTSGTTWHAAGAIGNLRGNSSLTRLVKDSIDLYETLEAETGQATGWVQTGSLRLASSDGRQVELERMLTLVRSYGIEADLITAREAQEKLPIMQVDDVRCALWMPGDGMANPSDVTMSMAKGARQNGVKIFERTRVLKIDVVNNEVRGVTTDQGTITCETLVLCTGIWTRELAATIGVSVPLQPTYVQYAITEPMPGLPRHAPSLRDPDLGTFFKEEVGGLSFGGYERTPVPYLESPVLPNEEFKLFEENIENFEYLMEGALHRIPSLENVGIKTWIHGLDSFTHDGTFILGEAPEVRNVFVGAGFNGFGIASGGGAGKALASWILEGEQPYDLWAADIRRFGAYMRSDRQVAVRAMEGFANHYAKGDPTEIFKAGRPLRLSAVHSACEAAGAVFEPIQGWEVPAWYAPKGEAMEDAIANEQAAAQSSVALFDLGSLAKFRILGPNATEVLQDLATSDIDKNRCAARTFFLSVQGRIQADVLTIPLAPNDHLIIAPANRGVLVEAHIRRHLLDLEDAVCVDVSAGISAFGLAGPEAREVIRVLSDREFQVPPPGSSNVISTIVAGAPVTLVQAPDGQALEWLLLVSSEYAVTVWNAIAKPRGGATLAGARALARIRFEAGIVDWGRDFGADSTPMEVSLKHLVDFGKPMFFGRDALLSAPENRPGKCLLHFVSENPDAMLSGAEAIFRDDKCVGWTTVGGWSTRLGRAMAIGFVREIGETGSYVDGTFELRKGATRIPVKIMPGYGLQSEPVHIGE